MSKSTFKKKAGDLVDEVEELDIRGSAQNAVSRIQEMCKDLSKEPVAKQAVLGGASGWVVGYLSIKVGKAVATVVGGGLILMQLAAHKGYIQVDWKRVNRDLEKNAKKLQKEVEAQVSGGKGQSASARCERVVNKTVEKLERELSSRSQWWFGRGQDWFERQYRRHFVSRDQRTLDTLYLVNAYLITFWAGSVLGIASGRRF